MKALANLEMHGWKKGGVNWGSEGTLSTISCSQFMADFESLLEKSLNSTQVVKRLNKK